MALIMMLRPAWHIAHHLLHSLLQITNTPDASTCGSGSQEEKHGNSSDRCRRIHSASKNKYTNDNINFK